MTRYILGRIGQAVLVLWIAYTVTFLILNLMPSNPLALRLGGAGVQLSSLSAHQLAALKAQYGLNKSIIDQYATLLWHALHLDFGESTSLSMPVSKAIGQRIGTTATLAGMAVAFMLVFGVGLAFVTVLVPWRPLRMVLKRLPVLAVSIPSFFVGLLLIQVFSFSLGWFPSTGTGGPVSYVLPALTMALPAGAVLAQVLIASFEKTMREPFIGTARAKGLSRAQIQWRHAFRNASLPALTVLGVLIGVAVTDAVIAETVFSMSGIGRLTQQAVLAQDVPLVQGIVLLAAALFVIVNLVVDLLYPLLEPRVAYTPNVL